MAELKESATLHVKKGSTEIYYYNIKNPDGSLVDMTGKSLRFNLLCGQVRLTLNSGTLSALGSNIIILNPPLNGFNALFKLSNEETDTFTQATGEWSMYLIDGGDLFDRGHGRISVKLNILH